jgi:hypothetical protein
MVRISQPQCERLQHEGLRVETNLGLGQPQDYERVGIGAVPLYLPRSYEEAAGGWTSGSTPTSSRALGAQPA